VGSTLQAARGGSPNDVQCVITSTGTPVGGIKHVWLIILENKSYDETFTGLNQNSYLWQTLPQQGALLTNYYGTGHFSMDNYISMVSGQSPSYGVQDDCSTTANMTTTTAASSRPAPWARRPTPTGRLMVAAPTRPPRTVGHWQRQLRTTSRPRWCRRGPRNNGCVYPTDVATLFNQYNAAGVSWKAYAQDLGGAQPVGSATYVTGATPGISDTVPGRDDGVCGYRDRRPPIPSRTDETSSRRAAT